MSEERSAKRKKRDYISGGGFFLGSGGNDLPPGTFCKTCKKPARASKAHHLHIIVYKAKP